MIDANIPSLAFTTALGDVFDQIFRETVSGTVSTDSVLIVVVFFAVFIGLITLALVFSKKPKGIMLDTPITWITGYRRILELLDAAMVQRSKIRVSFQRDLGRARSTDGTIVESGKDGIVLEISAVKAINEKWIGRTLECGFRLRLPENPKVMSNFNFLSEVISYEEMDEGVVLVRLSRPLRLELNQNRQHLRVEPPERFVRGIQLWSEDAVRRVGKPLDPDTWGAPLFKTLAGSEKGLKLENISGGGIRLEIAPPALRVTEHSFALNQQFFCTLTLLDYDETTLNTHYFLCKLVKCYDDCESRSQLSLGLIFSEQGLPQQPPLVGLAWRGVSRDMGIQTMDDWAYELHLELYRNKGLS